jgi:hypothetical protein
VRKFLSQVREPVVPFTYGKDIIKCLEDPNKAGNFSSLIGDLPIVGLIKFCHINEI